MEEENMDKYFGWEGTPYANKIAFTVNVYES